MALTSGTYWELRASATTGNVNGAGFNTANAAFVADLTTDSNTANTASPVVSSATYTFVAGDVNAWLYVASGTNWTLGWYQIASVAAGKATLSAAIGAAVQFDSATGRLKVSTVIGCATVGTPTSGTFGIDYSQQDTAQATNTNITCTAGSTTVTSAAAPFTRMMVGNIIHFTALTGTGAITGWYEIATFTDASNVVLDRTPTNGVNNITAGTFYVGGAGRFNGLEDAFLEMIPAASTVWMKSGAYTVSAAVAVISTNSTATLPSNIIGYTSIRSDTCNGSSRPVITASSGNSVAFGACQNLINLNFIAAAATGTQMGGQTRAVNCKFTNVSPTAARVGVTVSTDCVVVSCEVVSQNGTAVSLGTRGKVMGSYIHDSANGVGTVVSGALVIDNIIECCDTAGVVINTTSGSALIVGNTIYGREAKIGIGISFLSATCPANIIINNILYGLTTGVAASTIDQKSCTGLNNNYFNNTADVSLFTKGLPNYALNPQFTNVAQAISGSTATSAGSVLTQAGGDFSGVVDGVSYAHVLSGTGVTPGIYLVASHTGTTLTVNNPLGTSGAGDIVYYIPTAHNFGIGTNLRALGIPSFVGVNSETTGYEDIGAVQRQETAPGTIALTFAG